MITVNHDKLEEALTCGEILKLFKTLNKEKKLEVFLKLRDILWEEKNTLYNGEKSPTCNNKTLL